MSYRTNKVHGNTPKPTPKKRNVQRQTRKISLVEAFSEEPRENCNDSGFGSPMTQRARKSLENKNDSFLGNSSFEDDSSTNQASSINVTDTKPTARSRNNSASVQNLIDINEKIVKEHRLVETESVFNNSFKNKKEMIGSINSVQSMIEASEKLIRDSRLNSSTKDLKDWHPALRDLLVKHKSKTRCDFSSLERELDKNKKNDVKALAKASLKEACLNERFTLLNFNFYLIFFVFIR